MTAVEAVTAGEAERIAAVRRYEILDTPPDGTFDRITAVAARTFGVPMAVVSVVDTDRIWFKSAYGLDGVTEVDREPGLCASVILQDDALVVTDALHDPRTLANPLVAGELGLRFYVGVPLQTHDGHNLGTIAVLDRTPRDVTADQVEILRDLARVVVDELDVRLAARETITTESRMRRDAEQLADALQASLLPPRPPVIPGMQIATRYLPGEHALKVGGDFFDVWRLASNDWGLVLGDACGKGPRAASLAALARWTLRAASVHQFDPSEVLRDLNATLLADDGDDDDEHFCSVVFARLELDTCGAWVTLASAGHPLPLLVRASGKVELRGFESVPVGMFDDPDPTDDRVGLGPGDALVFYTDGITEARRPDGDLLGEDRLIDAMRGCSGADAEDMATRVVDLATTFARGHLGDDVAVLVVRVPADAADDPLSRLVSATGVPADQLRLPGYAHDTGRAPAGRAGPPGAGPTGRP